MKKLLFLSFLSIIILTGCSSDGTKITKENWPSNIPVVENFEKATMEENEITVYKISEEEASSYISTLKNNFPNVLVESPIYFEGRNDNYTLKVDYDKKEKQLDIEIDYLNQNR